MCHPCLQSNSGSNMPRSAVPNRNGQSAQCPQQGVGGEGCYSPRSPQIMRESGHIVRVVTATSYVGRHHCCTECCSPAGVRRPSSRDGDAPHGSGTPVHHSQMDINISTKPTKKSNTAGCDFWLGAVPGVSNRRCGGDELQPAVWR